MTDKRILQVIDLLVKLGAERVQEAKALKKLGGADDDVVVLLDEAQLLIDGYELCKTRLEVK